MRLFSSRLIFVACVIVLYALSAVGSAATAYGDTQTATSTTSSTFADGQDTNATFAGDASSNDSSPVQQTAVTAATTCGPAPSQATINTPSVYDWPTFQHDSARTGQTLMPAPFTNHELGKGKVRGAATLQVTTGGNQLYSEGTSILYADNSSTFTQFWTFTLSGKAQFSTSATYSGGNLYVGTTTGVLYSISASSGTVNWTFQPDTSPIYSTPLADSGLVIFGSDDDKVYAVSATSGSLVWSTGTGGMVRSSPAVSGGVVAIGSFDDKLYLLNEQTGATSKTYTTSGSVESSPSFSMNGAVVYFGSDGHNVYAVNAGSGSLAWSFATGGAVTASPSVSASGNVFVGSQDGNVYGLSSTGSLLWEAAVGSVSLAGAIGEGVYKSISQPFVELYYVPTTSGALDALRTDTGVLVWSLSNFTATNSPALAYTKLYIGDSAGNIHQIGSLRFATPVGTFTTGGVAQSTFSASQPIVVGANAAWGKMGIRGYIVNVTGPGKAKTTVVCDAKMTFTPGTTPLYNLYYTIPAGTLQGSSKGNVYKINVAIEDANPKFNSSNPRCCGWVDFKATVTVTSP